MISTIELIVWVYAQELWDHPPLLFHLPVSQARKLPALPPAVSNGAMNQAISCLTTRHPDLNIAEGLVEEIFLCQELNMNPKLILHMYYYIYKSRKFESLWLCYFFLMLQKHYVNFPGCNTNAFTQRYLYRCELFLWQNKTGFSWQWNGPALKTNIPEVHHYPKYTTEALLALQLFSQCYP